MVDACSSHGSKLAFLEQVSQCGPENRTPKHFTRLKKAGEGGWWKPTSLQTCHLGGRGQHRGGAPVLAVPLQQHHLPAGGQAEVERHLGGRGQRRGGAPVLDVPLQQHHLPSGGQRMDVRREHSQIPSLLSTTVWLIV